ncbi:MAG TPA: PHP-associated domain-containing protein [Dehalococcoidia bacterium]|nr:PHP-associated domain-containing protein [Dehalococcoidia bacterium]
MGKADLHIHTTYGDGMAGVQEILEYVEEHTDLSVIAITEHDRLDAALDARERWAAGRYRFDLVVGEEITTIEGHLIALFIEEPVPSLRPLRETLAAVHRLGGLCIIPHPMSWLTRSVGQRVIERILAEGAPGVAFDGIETVNLGPAGRIGMRKASSLNGARYHLADIGGSDAHFLQAIGSAYTEFEGTTAQDLRCAIEARATRAVAGRYPRLSDLGWRNIFVQQWRGLMATPRAQGWIPTVRSFIKRVLP